MDREREITDKIIKNLGLEKRYVNLNNVLEYIVCTDTMIGLDGQFYSVNKNPKECSCGVPTRGSYALIKPLKDVVYKYLGEDLDDQEQDYIDKLVDFIEEKR